MNAETTSQRLQETAAKCLSSLDAWNNDLTDENARETLQDAVHELRKVTSRLEIDIAMNDRKNTNAKPMPIPEHKSKMEKKKQKPLSEILPVAELKEAGEKRRIAIQEAADQDDESGEDINEQIATPDMGEAEERGEKPKKRRHPRRKKSDSEND